MIRLDRAELLHWDIQPHQVLPFATGITLLTGENGSGKSSILDGIKVALGVTRLGGDRTIEKYLSNQARPVAMVRVVADNRPLAGTRQRPFDRLGEFASDLVTLAVVFRAQDEAKYVHEYYLLDGDVVPPLEGGRRTSRHLPGPTDYRQRLAKVGITDRYLKLLSLAQGQIASLCKRDPNSLFDDLYDIIGGRQTLEAWETRLTDLRHAQEQHDAVGKDLENARLHLQVLAARVRRHEDWRQAEARCRAVAAALPHVELREARIRVERLADQVKRLSSEIEATLEAMKQAGERARTATEKRDARLRRKERIKLEVKELGRSRDEVKEQAASARAEFTHLDGLRAKGERVEWDDIERLGREGDARRADRATLAAESGRRQIERQRAGRDLAQVKNGILPLPDEVERFRTRLKNEGIAHHFLYEVVELPDVAWQPALEGYLGRYRFAVLVHDMTSWSRAAALARDERYPHGVLAPDVRGHSPLDESGVFRQLHVQDRDYRALIARLLRPVVEGEPALPLEPTRRGELLSREGFVVSRIEARHAHAEKIYLGREALGRRAKELEEELAGLDEADAGAHEQDETLKGALKKLDEQIEAQRARRAWEGVRDRHAELRARVQELDEEHKRRGAEIDGREAEIDAIDAELSVLQPAIGSETQKEKDAQEASDKKTHDRLAAESELSNAEISLGKLLAAPPSDADTAVRTVLDEGSSLLTLKTQLAELTGRTSSFTDDERDPMLPINHQRQTQEVGAVEERLEKLAESIDKTREAADRARHDYQRTTRLIFRDYFARLRRDAEQLGFGVDGELVNAENGRFRCEVRVGIDQKSPVHYTSSDLSGGQKAALSILMAMTAVSLESDGAGFFLVDEPFSASDVYKINELGDFLARTKAQYLVSMPTSSDVAQCGEWLSATWISTKSQGGFDVAGRPVLAPSVKLNFSNGTRDGWCLSLRLRTVAVADDRREWHGGGGVAPEGVERLLAAARGGRQCKWDGIGRRIGRGHDQVDVERILWAAVDAGLLVVLERKNRRGDWEPYRWRLTANGDALVARKEEPIDVAGFLAETDDPNQPVLAAIRTWLENGGGSPTCTRIVVAIGQELRAGRVPRERILSTRMTGFSKGIRIDDYRVQLEEALGLPLEEFVRKSGDSAIAAGPIRFRVNGIETDVRGIPPWLALPIETVEAIEWLTIEADRLVTIENLTAFEEEVRRGLARGTIALYVGGFAGRVERRLLDRLIAAGIRRIDHWSDLDLGGLRILRQLQSLVSIEVRAYRMEADLLHRLPTQPLTDNDRVGLRAWVADRAAPVRELAQALLTTGRKAEQEGWFLLHRRG